MIYVYRNSSKSATALATVIKDEGGSVTRLRNFDARPMARDLIVNWGAYIPRWPWPNARILNAHIIGDKFRELNLIRDADVPVPEFRVSPRRPNGRWIARRFTHEEANDVRADLEIGDYYTKWLDLDAEFRFHIFNGQSIQRQYKVADGLDNEGNRIQSHPWIRCTASGWNWYNGGDGAAPLREAAKRAVRALGYDFGAVDVGRIRTGGFVVLEVNSSPGVDPRGATIHKYAKAIIGLQ